MNEHDVAIKIAEMCGIKNENLILDIERTLLHFGHSEWKKGYLECSEMVKSIFSKEAEQNV